MIENYSKHNVIRLFVISLIAICLTSFAFGFMNNSAFFGKGSFAQEHMNDGNTNTEFAGHHLGELVNSEKTIQELVSISDVIVRVVVNEQLPRTLTIELPAYGADADTNNSLEELGNVEAIQLGTKQISTIYTDSNVTVLEAYKGSTTDNITIMQLGNNLDGVFVANTGVLSNEKEYIVFLIDISGDDIHAPNRTLYRTINPWGIYTIAEDKVIVNGELDDSTFFPTNLEELEVEIETVVDAG